MTENGRPRGDLPDGRSRQLSAAYAEPSERRPACCRHPGPIASCHVGDRTLAATRFRLSLAAVLSLIALRVVIGWHFYQEGVTKLQGAPFSSGALFGTAKGPLAPYYRAPIYDPYGEFRLDRKKTELAWAKYRDTLIRRAGDDAKLKKRLQQIEAAHRRQLRSFFDEIGPDLEEYLPNVRRLKKYRQDAARGDVPGLRKQIATIEQELKKKGSPWLSQIDSIWNDFEAEMRRTYAESTGESAPALRRLGRRWYDTETIDRIVPYFDTAIGAMLILGLFTRLASWCGAIFLASIVASQWPGTPDAIPTYYQTIECLALVTLATVGAGRFGALDTILAHLWRNCCRSKGEEQR